MQPLLDLMTSRNWTVARAFHHVNGAVTRVLDPLVTYRLNGHRLRLPLSHALPWMRRALPLYFDNLRRLAAFLRERDGALRMVDVGANVGDSWALAGPVPGDAFLLIEGSARFFPLLERNTRDDPAVVRVRALLADRRERIRGEMVEDRGNARLRAGGETELQLETLDALLEAHPAFRASRLLKVDTEGYDRRVLAGARGFLADAGPVLLFEHQPRELMQIGEDERAIFRDLAALGYDRFVLYDHRGYLLGAVAGDEEPWLESLMRYARHQDHYYFDVAAFHHHDADAATAFLAREREFFTSLES
jgi:FkbM family methyltransferase